jgi:hypothetical protein
MRVIANLNAKTVPATLELIIHHAPHRRMHIRMIQVFREELRRACKEAKIFLPIDTTVDLSVLWINPSSPDYDNLLTALFQAMDGATLKGPGILSDDSKIGTIKKLAKYHT